MNFHLTSNSQQAENKKRLKLLLKACVIFYYFKCLCFIFYLLLVQI